MGKKIRVVVSSKKPSVVVSEPSMGPNHKSAIKYFGRQHSSNQSSEQPTSTVKPTSNTIDSNNKEAIKLVDCLVKAGEEIDNITEAYIKNDMTDVHGSIAKILYIASMVGKFTNMSSEHCYAIAKLANEINPYKNA